MLMKSTQPVNNTKQTIHLQQQHYSGPLPHPEALERYNQIVPGAAERIIKMAEKEMDHRHKNEDVMTRSAIRTTIMSIIFAFVSVLILSGLVFYALTKGFDVVAGSIAVGSIAAVSSVFIFFKKKKG